MQYLVKFKSKASRKIIRLNVSAACVSDAWQEAEKCIPPGYEVLDVAPMGSYDAQCIRSVG